MANGLSIRHASRTSQADAPGCKPHDRHLRVEAFDTDVAQDRCQRMSHSVSHRVGALGLEVSGLLEG